MIRILNVEPQGYSAEARAVLEQLGDVVEADLDRAALLRELPNYDVLIVRLRHRVDREVIEAGMRLKAIVSATTGLDHIDLDYAKQKGITVLSLRGETEFLRTIPATAEHTWALLLALVRRLPEAAASVRAGDWNRDDFKGHDLAGKRLGIVGLGRIGRRVAGYGQAFEMTVAAYDPHARVSVAGVQQAHSLEDLLKSADVLSLHVPLNDDTTGLIGRAELALMPARSVLVNTSRGEVLDEAALCGALESGRLSGAALDVMCNERDEQLRRRSPLLAYAARHDNLILTPHIAGATYESMERTELFMARKLAVFLASSRAGESTDRSLGRVADL